MIISKFDKGIRRRLGRKTIIFGEDIPYTSDVRAKKGTNFKRQTTDYYEKVFLGNRCAKTIIRWGGSFSTFIDNCGQEG